jgi:hypothetical protein
MIFPAPGYLPDAVPLINSNSGNAFHLPRHKNAASRLPD